MKSLADGLPPEIAKHIDPDWRKNEAAYWALRQLLAAYKDQWIAFVDGEVVASGKRPVMVYHAAMKWGSKAFVTCVGRENEPMRIRRTNFAYDMSYPGEALPVLTVEFRPVSGSPGLPMSQVIADTGADTSILPWVDCRRLNLDPARGMPGIMGGVGGGTAISLTFSIWVQLDGQEYPCQIQVDFIGTDRILGRDVLNSMDVLFRGPSREVVVNP